MFVLTQPILIFSLFAFLISYGSIPWTILYSEFFTNAYGYALENSSTLTHSKPIVSNNTVFDSYSNNFRISNLKLQPWGGSRNHLNVLTNDNNSVSVFKVTGTTGNGPAGFSTFVNYKGKYVSLDLGNVVKKSINNSVINPQVSFDFYIDGDDGKYHLILVQGRLYIHGWQNNNFYDNIDPFSSRLIKLDDLISSHRDRYSSINRLTISFERNIMINPIEFRIGFYNNTFPVSR